MNEIRAARRIQARSDTQQIMKRPGSFFIACSRADGCPTVPIPFRKVIRESLRWHEAHSGLRTVYIVCTGKENIAAKKIIYNDRACVTTDKGE
jgi:hypothetical protein